MFTAYGEVKYVRVIQHERGFNRGYSTGRAIVCFGTPGAASSAIGKMNGRVFYGKPMCVEYYKSGYELRKEMFDTYFGRKEHGKMPTKRNTNPVPREPIDPNDAASIKQTYADRLAAFVRPSHPQHYEEITELLLEYDNDQLKAYLETPLLLQTQVDNAATLVTIRALMD
uniref:RRM domain-containing protein n=1 Tax=Anopheles maculatus TaxID=74869 RepID=A0A182T8E5_9DIPT